MVFLEKGFCENCRKKVFYNKNSKKNTFWRKYVNIVRYPETKKKPFIFCSSECRDNWVFSEKSDEDNTFGVDNE